MENHLAFTLASSGNQPDAESSTLIELSATTHKVWVLATIRAYFLERIGDLEAECAHATPWVFINAAVLLEYLANLVIDPEKPDPKNSTRKIAKTDLERYMEFVCGDWLPDQYKNFSFINEYDGVTGKSKQDLPLQMYCVLRSAMVHSFSMIPESSLWTSEKRDRAKSPIKFARKGSIVICHAKSGNTHLGDYPQQDAACFVAEEFVKDIRIAIENIFETARQQNLLEARIEQVVNARPPLGIVEK